MLYIHFSCLLLCVCVRVCYDFNKHRKLDITVKTRPTHDDND